MQTGVVIVGGGGHAKVVIDIFRQSDRWDPVACVDDALPVGSLVDGVPVAGGDACLSLLRQDGVSYAFVAIGDNTIRHRLMQQVVRLGFKLPNAISPYAYVAASATLGQGLAIMPGAVVGPGTTLGDGVIANTRSSIDHDGIVETCGHVAPGATLTGCVHVEAYAMVAAGATVVPQCRIGRGTVVGAGAVVVSDLPPYVVAYGVPARIQRYLERRNAA